MQHLRTVTRGLIGTIVVVGGLAALAPSAQADSLPVACSETALVAAVNLANSTVAADTLVLAAGCTYRMTASHGNAAHGQDALPLITTSIELIGPATITRASLLPFRIAEVSPTGALTLTTSVALTNGSAVGSGGAILNFGAVTLTGSSLSGNTATLNGGGLANADTAAGTAPAATFTSSLVSGNTALRRGGGIYNGLRGTLTTTGVPLNGNTARRGGGIAAVDSTATTLTSSPVSSNLALVTAGGVYRLNGTMTTTSSPISANTANNCVGSAPAVPSCTG